SCWCFFFSSRRRHTRSKRDWSSDVCSSDLGWGVVEGSRLRLEFPITKGRLIGQGRRAKPLFADYVLEYKNRRIGVIEAKKRDDRSEERRVGKECRCRWAASC